jgi:cysteine desulfurase
VVDSPCGMLQTIIDRPGGQVPPIYLDHNASTPLDPAVAEEMRGLVGTAFGNPSSDHWAGRPARKVVDAARVRTARLLGCDPAEIVFTGGGSEANNLVLKGIFFAARRRGVQHPHFVTTAVEHPAILEPLRFLEGLGAGVTLVPVDGRGRVDPGAVARALRPETILVSVMHANNEVGTVQPVAEIAAIAAERGIPIHTDAAQSVGKIPACVGDLGVGFLSVAAHKFYGPKGVGALFIRKGLVLEPLIHGAGHESGRRAGTENVLLTAGMGCACEVAASQLGMPAVRALRDRLEREILSRFTGRVSVNGHPTERLPNTLSVNFHGRAGAELLASLGDIAASTGSACHSGSVTLSPVLRAMSVPPEIGMGAVRFSLGRTTTSAEIDEVLRRLEAVVR